VSARFPSPKLNVGGVLWAGVSPLCGLMIYSQLGGAPGPLSGPIMHVGDPTTGYVCVGSDWTRDTSQTGQGSALWVAPEQLAAIYIGPAATGSAQSTATAARAANPGFTFVDWTERLAGNDALSTVAGHAEVLVDTGSWPDGITTYTVAYQTGQDTKTYFTYYFDDPSQPGTYRIVTFIVESQPDTATWQAVFGQADSASVMSMVLMTYRWRPGIGLSAQTPGTISLDLYTDCTQPSDAGLAVCQNAFSPTVLPTLV